MFYIIHIIFIFLHHSYNIIHIIFYIIHIIIFCLHHSYNIIHIIFYIIHMIFIFLHHSYNIIHIIFLDMWNMSRCLCLYHEFVWLIYKDKGSYESSPPCIINLYNVCCIMNLYLYSVCMVYSLYVTGHVSYKI